MSQWQSKTSLPKVVITGPDALSLEDTTWDDARFPFFGRRIDTAAGHLDYDKVELGVNFDDTSRYDDNDQVAIIAQLPHAMEQGTDLHPHIHWIQSSADVPNMLLKYRMYDNGETPPAWILAAISSHSFAYSSGSILQISSWPTIDASSLTEVSGFVDIKIFRDVANASGLFAGADPLVGNWLAKEFDFHIEINSIGSRNEYIK